MPVEDLGPAEATELLSLANLGEVRSLGRLASLAVGQVPGCSGAHATVWRNGEMVASAATHPDAAALADLELAAGDGPLVTAAREARDVYCPDTLAEERWPHWAAQALGRGVRSSAHLVRQLPPMTLVLALFGVRADALDADAVPMAETLARFGTAALANTMAYGEAQRTAVELRDAVAARAVTDQAKGILMHALGCSADEALRFMRRESQQRHIKVTEVAARVIAAYGGPSSGGQEAASRPAREQGPETSRGRRGGSTAARRPRSGLGARAHHRYQRLPSPLRATNPTSQTMARMMAIHHRACSTKPRPPMRSMRSSASRMRNITASCLAGCSSPRPLLRRGHGPTAPGPLVDYPAALR